MVTLNADLQESADKAQKALEEYEAITKESLKREMEAREVIRKLKVAVASREQK